MSRGWRGIPPEKGPPCERAEFGCVILSDGDYSAARGEAAAESALNTSHTWPVSCWKHGCREFLGHSVAHAGPIFPPPWLCLLL